MAARARPLASRSSGTSLELTDAARYVYASRMVWAALQLTSRKTPRPAVVHDTVTGPSVADIGPKPRAGSGQVLRLARRTRKRASYSARAAHSSSSRAEPLSTHSDELLRMV